MDPDTFRGDVGVPDPDVYWRRRISVLTALLVVVAMVVWACTRTSDEPTGAADGPAPSAAAQGRDAGGSGASGGSGEVTNARPAAETMASPTPRPARRPGGQCEEKDLVVHLEGLQEVYGAKVRPRFLVMLVNTGADDCVTDVGPRGLEMRITSGPDRVWSSADCVSGDSRQLRRLERGVPFIRTVNWDRRRSGRDCSASHLEARSGTYVATAVTGSLRSPKTVFHLR
jgi:hypothetical protein